MNLITHIPQIEMCDGYFSVGGKPLFRIKTIGQRITFIMVMLLIYVIVIGAVVITQMNSMEKKTNHITRDVMPAIRLIHEITFTPEHIQKLSYDYYLATDEARKKAIEEERVQTIRYLAVTRESYEALISGDEIKKQYDAFVVQWEAYSKLNAQAIEKINSNNSELALEVIQKSETSYRNMLAELTTLSELTQQEADSATVYLEKSSLHSKWILIVGIALIIIATLISMVVLIRALVKPIREIENNVKAIADGDLTVDDIVREKEDELSSLGVGINQMKVNLLGIVRQIKASSRLIESHSADLAVTSEEVKLGSQQIAISMEESAKATESQAETASSSARTVEMLNEHIEDHASKGEQLKGMSELVLEQGTRGKDIMQKSIEQMNQIANRVSFSMNQVNHLDKSNENIDELVRVIREIAKQTNMLSLNASIEASRAGEHGRGFAVVAEEVRSLSEAVRQTVGQITELTNQIQQDTKSVAEALESGVQETVRGTHQMEEVKDAFEQITSSVSEMVAVINEVADGLTGMKHLSGEMNDFSQQISAISQQSAAGVEEVSASAEQQVGSLEVVADRIVKLKMLSEDLLASISQLRV